MFFSDVFYFFYEQLATYKYNFKCLTRIVDTFRGVLKFINIHTFIVNLT